MQTGDISHEVLLDQLYDGVYFIDEQQVITYWNRGAERITGHNRHDTLGKKCLPDLLEHVTAEGVRLFDGVCPIVMSMRDGEVRERELFIRHQDGRLIPVMTRTSPILNGRGEAIGALEVFSDNSSKVYARQRIQELEEMALLCPLTGAGNRRYAQIQIRNACEELRRYGWPFGVLFADIDDFKGVNDTYGHAAGDEVLCMVAHALDSCLRSFDFVGRWGGEEFLVILPNITVEVLSTVAERCRRLIEESVVRFEGQEIQVTVSLGAVMARADETPEICIERADLLMYQSKANGRNRVSLEP